MKKTVKSLFDEIQVFLKSDTSNAALPENTFFLDDNKILCLLRKEGESRYPYGEDGFYLWAYQSGHFSANESTFTIFPLTDEGKRPYLAFFFGEKKQDRYYPVSFTGACIQPCEQVKRYTVFTPWAAYYLTESKEFRLALRITVNQNKGMEYTLYAENLTNADKDVYFSTYINPILRFQMIEDFESKWFKSSTVFDNGFLFESKIDLSRTEHINYYAVAKRYVKGELSGIETTTSHTSYTGDRSRPLNCSEVLFSGSFENPKKTCSFTDTAIAGELVKLKLKANSACEENILFETTTNKEKAQKMLNEQILEGEFDDRVNKKELERAKRDESNSFLKISFGEYIQKQGETSLNNNVLNRFIKSVINQVEYCALAKTSSLAMLGIRDVFQQIESALIWNAEACRKKILEALNFVGADGRVPRQYSLPADKKSIPVMDLRAFIDQGVWIIDTIYMYLAYTGDLSLLNEECGYYIYKDNKVYLTEKRDSVFNHLVLILDYLIKNIDDNTNCLRILYGDWNDALDGLGATKDNDKEFGSGVSVMASLQLVKNLREFCEIVISYGLPCDKIEFYTKTYERVKKGLMQYAVVTQGEESKVLHGWGDKRSYLVGSFCDVDGCSRDGLAANAYWVISDGYSWNNSIKKHILNAFKRLDSKYGLKTFEPFFNVGTMGVGRITNLPKGTAENGATYVHATLFGIWALFLLNEGEFAWEQLYKVLPQTHKKISTSPFIMSNSYVYNEEFDMDGESMNDWYTGSATVLIKVLLRCIFGINLTQSTLTVNPANYFPFENAKISFKVRGCLIEVSYVKKNNDKRKYFIDNKEVEKISIDFDNLSNKKVINIID